MNKTLVLVRHGHRDNSKREIDNGLDDKGKEQAKHIKRYFQDRFSQEDLKSGLWLASSPKIRCVETLQPLAKTLDKQIDIHPGLDEQSLREGGPALEARIQTFLSEWKKSGVGITVLSSHGDWIPMATQRLLGVFVDPKKGSWLEIANEGGALTLKSYIPTFKHFYS
jgi:broad specificity phosphatase PhoE